VFVRVTSSASSRRARTYMRSTPFVVHALDVTQTPTTTTHILFCILLSSAICLCGEIMFVTSHITRVTCTLAFVCMFVFVSTRACARVGLPAAAAFTYRSTAFCLLVSDVCNVHCCAHKCCVPSSLLSWLPDER